MEALSEFTGRVRALKNVKEVQLDNIPNLEKCVLLTAFKCVESARVTNASLLGDMKQLRTWERERWRRPRRERRD